MFTKWSIIIKRLIRRFVSSRFCLSIILYYFSFSFSHKHNLIFHVFFLFLSYILQNFDAIPHVTPGREAYYGGSVSLADYCPYIQEFVWRSKSVVIRGSHCQYPENNPREYNIFKYILTNILHYNFLATYYYCCNALRKFIIRIYGII